MCIDIGLQPIMLQSRTSSAGLITQPSQPVLLMACITQNPFEQWTSHLCTVETYHLRVPAVALLLLPRRVHGT